MAAKKGETIELTEVVILHGDSLSGSDLERAAKLERIKTLLREREIDFVDQPEALEVWVGTGSRDQVIEALEALGYRVDLYEL